MNTLKSSTDVWFCSFLLSKHIPIADYKKKEYGKVECFFALTDQEWKTLKIEFDNSDIVNFKGYIQRIKDLSY